MNTKLLKQRILDLAIHGRLVPQNPDDEPASQLLRRISEEKEKLIAQGKIKRPKKSDAINPAQECPFEIPNSWEWVNLNNICDIKGGKRIPQGMSFAKEPTSHIYIRVTDMKNNTILSNDLKYIDDNVFEKIKNYLISYSDLYLTIAGTIGAVGEVPKMFDGMNLTENAAKLTNIQCNKKYLMFVLMSTIAQEHFKSKFHQVAQPKLSIETAQTTLIPLPPIAEQQRIVSAIEKWFSLIDEIETNKESLQATIKQTKSKVLDLAIKGKLVKKTDEWKMVTLGEIGKWQAGGTPSRGHKEYYGGEIPWLKTGDLNDGFITEIPEHITQLGLEKSSAKLNPKDSVLIAMYGATIGKVGILTFPAATNQACCACTEYKDVDKMYLFYFLLSHREIFISQGGGGAQPNISKDIIVKTTIPLPPLSEQTRIVSKIEEVFALLDEIERELA